MGLNICVFTGRFTRDPEIRYSTGEKATAVARFSLAVNRDFKREGEPDADFPNFVAFGKTAEAIGKYFHRGKPIVICRSHVQTGNYVNKDGVKVYTTDFVVDQWSFPDTDNSANKADGGAPTQTQNNSWMNMPENSNDDDEYPF